MNDMLHSFQSCVVDLRRKHQQRPLAARETVAGTRQKKYAFTLTELLVVITVISVLLALLLPAIQAVRESARRASCLSNLRQIGVALHTFHSANREFPIGSMRHSTERHSWNTQLLPYVGQSATWELYDFDHASRDPENRPAASTVIPVFLCPSTRSFAKDRLGRTTGDANGNGAYDTGDDMAFTDYGGLQGKFAFGPAFNNGMLIYDKAVRIRDVSDGLDTTIIVAEDTGRGAGFNGEWANGDNVMDIMFPINHLRDNEIYSDHVAGSHVLFASGSVTFLPKEISVPVLAALCTRASGDEAYIEEF